MPGLHFILISFILAFFYFLVAKALSYRWKPRGKELFFAVLFSLLFAMFSLLIRSRSFPLPETAIGAAKLGILFLFSFKVQAYARQASFQLAFFSIAIALTAEQVFTFFLQLWSAALPGGTSARLLLYFFLLYGVGLPLAALFAHVFRGLATHIEQNSRLQLNLTFVTALLFFAFLTVLAIQELAGEMLTLFSWNFMFLLIFVLASLVSFAFYARMQSALAAVREKEIEQQAMLRYMGECEQQQSAMRKFKHDYQNILISIDSFLDAGDLSGLKQYYAEKIKPASDVIVQSDFALEQLSKIKVQEIKSILATKLIMAQNLRIDARVEVVEEIDHIPVDSVSLVRILGIILDNAIEELAQLGEGQLTVACYKGKKVVNIVVQNTCRVDLQDLRKLGQSGFSTKGEGRGLGLSNLAELVDLHAKDISLQTSIKGGNFIQKLWIGGKD